MKRISFAGLSLFASVALAQQQTPQKTFQIVEPESASPFEILALDEFPSYSVRIKKTALCDDTVDQYSGYLDIADDAHLFFWMFSSRNKPGKDPVTLWLNGGPGGSSQLGNLMELGPCRINEGGLNTTWNPYSWNSVSTMIFLDQPVPVGFSYGSPETRSSVRVGKDVYSFLQLLFKKFPEFSTNSLHITGESYGGMYVPNIAAHIVEENVNLATKSRLRDCNEGSMVSEAIPLNIESVFIGNGITDPLHQFGSVFDYGCEPSEYAFIPESNCDQARQWIDTCHAAVNLCQSMPSILTCVLAETSCSALLAVDRGNLNPYDIRKSCAENPLCYNEMTWIETYLNAHKKDLGVPADVNYTMLDWDTNARFHAYGDMARGAVNNIVPLIDAGVRVGIYVGEYDSVCDFVGNLAWMENLEWEGKELFNEAEFATIYSEEGVPEGVFKGVGSGSGHFTFVKVFDSGHMVPYDQPDASLHLFSNWIANEPLDK